MSFVGPRPERPTIVAELREHIPFFDCRHMVKPGITGWAQVNGLRGETDTLEKMKKRLEYDLEYIENWSLGLDLRILLLTALTGWVDRNAY